MSDHIRDLFEAMNNTANDITKTANALHQAADGIIQAADGIKEMSYIAIRASEEHEDLRASVRKLEVDVLKLMNRLPPHA